MIIRSLALFSLILAVNTSHAQVCNVTKHSKIPSLNGLSYHKARTLLLSAGWQALQTKPNIPAKDDPDIGYGNGKEFWSRGYIEVEACSGTGLARCSFLFSDVYGNRLRVVTAGEEIPKEKESAKVTGWKFDCK